MTDERTTRRLQMELTVLRAICSGQGAGDLREMSVRGLSVYSWKSAEHRVVFEAIVRLGRRDAERLREELPAQATRMGFPDVEWAAYFAAGEEERADLQVLVRELIAAGAQDAETNRT